MSFEKIDKDSPITISSAVNFFDVDPTNVTNLDSRYKEFLPSNPIDEPPITFKLPPSVDYPDWAHSYLKTEIQVFKQGQFDANPVAIDAGDNISLCQAPGATCFKNNKMHVKGREISNPNNYNAFKNIMEIELNYSKEVKKSFLGLMGYYHDDKEQNDPSGKGFIARRKLILDGRRCELITRLDADPCNIDKYWPNNTEVDFVFYPNDANFMIVAPNKVATLKIFFLIKSCKLNVLYHNLYDGLNNDIQNRLNHTSIKYFIKKTEMKTVNLEAGRTELSVNIFNEQIPTRVVIGMLLTTDYHGDIKTSPFNFKPFDIREIHLECFGRQYPNVLYDLNFGNDAFARPYYDMNHALGNAFTNKSNGITMDDYKNGKCFFVFDLTSGMDQNGGIEIIRQGSTSLHALFRTALTHGVTMVIYAEYDSMLMIGKNRTVTTDMTV